MLFSQPSHAFLGSSSEESSEPSVTSELEAKTKAAIEKLVNMMGKVIEHLPQYEMPEVLENGDIIIRRKQPETNDDIPPEGRQI